ncbi:MAG: phosphate ABC transporter substrate-binding protein PstS [Thioalkalispiraceae bacterium]|jgi:phosphate transport system substrate-binding protein
MLSNTLTNGLQKVFAKGNLAAGIIGVSLLSNYALAAEIISGAGATFPYPVYAKWAESYAQKTGIKVNYQSIGSGGGIKQIEAKTVDFGASDAPLKPEELEKNGLMQFPMIMGGVVPIINVQGIKPGELKLSGQVLADIYLGKITHWNDKAIKTINPHAKLPDKNITVVHRSDGSGTTWIFTNYLTKVSDEWAKKVGNDKSVAWPTGIGGKGNEGVASYVGRVKDSIGYVEYAYALQNKMTYAKLRNKAGYYVTPSTPTFQAAAANADWKKAPGFYMVLTDQPGKDSWPITGASFILVYKHQQQPNTAKNILKFFDWSYHHGGKLAEALDYVPMPKQVISLVENTWQKDIKGSDGQSLWSNGMVQK